MITTAQEQLSSTCSFCSEDDIYLGWSVVEIEKKKKIEH